MSTSNLTTHYNPRGTRQEYYEPPPKKSFPFDFFKKSNGGSGRGLLQSLQGLSASLDGLGTNVFIADYDLNLIYANKKAHATLQSIESEIQDAFGLRVDELLGGSIHRFHTDPQQVERILRNPSALPHAAELAFGKVVLKTNINGIYGVNGEPLGYIVNWEEVGRQKEVEAEMQRIRSMMENAPINIMYADKDLILRYMNPTSAKTLQALRQYLPVAPSEAIGKSIDIFHKNPAQQRRILMDPKNLPHQTQIQLGPETLHLQVNAVCDGDGNYLGPMVSWEVITEKLELERQNQENAQREKDQARELQEKVDRLLEVVRTAARGDLTRKITVKGGDAIGQMGTELDKFFATLRNSIASIGENADSLSGSSEKLTAVSQQLAGNAEETSAQAGVVSAASEQVSSNINTVATGAEEMSASIQEIAQNAHKAADVTASAVKMAQTTNTTISKLGDSSAEIGEVVKVITSIAGQTNLLALNATIEAARAGEAGKGFAVVANEVKELAKETAKATEEISNKIQAIQGDTQNAVQAIGDIAGVIDQINDISSTIAGAMEEQAATTNEITRNAQEMARGAAEIAQNITGVAQAAQDTSAGAGETQTASAELARVAGGLEKLVGQFKY